MVPLEARLHGFAHHGVRMIRRAAPVPHESSPVRQQMPVAAHSQAPRRYCAAERAWPMRRIGLPSVRCRTGPASSAASSSSWACPAVPLVEIGQGIAPGELLPRACQLAVVATVDAVAQQRTHVLGECCRHAGQW